jgi:hypothetical protein
MVHTSIWFQAKKITNSHFHVKLNGMRKDSDSKACFYFGLSAVWQRKRVKKTGVGTIHDLSLPIPLYHRNENYLRGSVFA